MYVVKTAQDTHQMLVKVVIRDTITTTIIIKSIIIIIVIIMIISYGFSKIK